MPSSVLCLKQRNTRMLRCHLENRHQCAGNFGSRGGFSERETFLFFAKTLWNGKSNWLCCIRPGWKQTSVEVIFVFVFFVFWFVLTKAVCCHCTTDLQRPRTALLESNCSKIFTQLTPMASWRVVFLFAAVSQSPHPCTSGFHLSCCTIHWEN